MQLTKDKFQPWIDVTLGKLPVHSFARIDKSTVFELAWNPATEDKDYIDQKNSSTVLTGYQMSLPEEIILDNTNPVYAFLDAYFEGLPVGTDCVVPFLLVKPDLATGEPTRALFWPSAELHPDNLNTVDGILSFTVQLNGDPVVGSARLEGGSMVFTEGAYATEITVPDEAVSVTEGATASGACTPAEGSGYIVYASADPATATVDADGTVHGVKQGSTTVHVMMIAGGTRVTASFDVTVTAKA